MKKKLDEIRVRIVNMRSANFRPNSNLSRCFEIFIR